MKKIALLSMFIVSSVCVHGQSYLGFLTDNYSGVNGVIANPANITDSRFKTDIHLAGASAFVGNDYYGVNLLDVFNADYDFDNDARKSPSTDNNAGANLDVFGPAFMFNLTPKSSIALFTRARYFANFNEFNGNTIAEIDADPAFININEGDFNTSQHVWGEFGVTYARTLLNKRERFLKGGITLKYLQGGGQGYVNGENINVDYVDIDPRVGNESSIDIQGDVSYGRFDDVDSDGYEYELPEARGLGADIGFVFEWRPNYLDYTSKNSKGEKVLDKHSNKYKLKLGLSITDIGSINYKDGVIDNYSIAADQDPFTEDDFSDADDIDAFLEEQFGVETSTDRGGYKVSLPTALHINADWSFTKHLYANLNTDLSLVAKNKATANRVFNTVSLTPRFESRWFSFYLPLTVVQHSGFQAGAGLRFGPLYLGSGSVITALTSDNTQAADVYAGLKIPVYQGKSKDRDNDGVIDKLDACPKVAGPVENDGCPWEDKDGDSILDKDDKCPDVAGPEKNNGCPWEDKDNDSVLDNVDACVNIAGPVANNGCPWPDTDNDGVLDKDDKCVDVAGTVANNGCPEVKAVAPTVITPQVSVEVQKSLNNYAKTILFNTGKSSIKNESTQVLNDIVNILKEYPAARFYIEGHTDSVGSSTLNQRLSNSRAQSVKSFLVSHGIDTSRLQAIGYGEERPIATNATTSGRSQNRRVEINLIK